MMRFGFALAAGLAAGAGLTTPAAASPASVARAAITAAYARMSDAVQRRDADAYVASLSPDFVGVYPKGLVVRGRQGEAATLRQTFGAAKTLSASTRLVFCVLKDGGAVVTVQESTALSGQNAGGPLEIKDSATLRGFWVKSGGRWLLKRERSVADVISTNGVEERTVDGRPAAAPGGPAEAEGARLTEESGGFSYIPPDGWQIKTFAGMKYLISYGPRANGFTPNINVQDELAPVPLDDYARLNLIQISRMYADFKPLGRTAFVTASGLSGVRLAADGTLMGQHTRQVFYLFPAAGARKIIVVATWLASDGNKYAPAVDASLKTFRLEQTP